MTRDDDAPIGAKTAALRDDIARTRAELTETVWALEARLAPDRLEEALKGKLVRAKEQLKDEVEEEALRLFHEAKAELREDLEAAKARVRQATIGRVEDMVDTARNQAREAGSTVLETIRENPVPAALVGIGLAWLVFGGRRGPGRYVSVRVREGAHAALDRGEALAWGARRRAHEAGERIGGLAHEAGERIGGLAHEAGERIGGLAHEAGDALHEARSRAGTAAADVRGRTGAIVDDVEARARDLGTRGYEVGKERLHDAEQGFERMLEANPLAVGAVAFAVGAAAGLALPHTAKEDALLGPVKGELLKRAQGLAEEAFGQVEHVARDAFERAERVLEPGAGARA